MALSASFCSRSSSTQPPDRVPMTRSPQQASMEPTGRGEEPEVFTMVLR